MKIKIEEKNDNALLQRQDITFLVDHTGTATPPRVDVRAKLAAMLNCKEDQLYIIKLTGQYGQSISQGYAHLYPSKDAAAMQEQVHIKKRHGTEEAAPPPAMKPAKPVAEEKKEEVQEEPKEKAEKPQGPPVKKEAEKPEREEDKKEKPKAEKKEES
ncbi:hypothetical protein E2P71_10470 [Candidatus Bathyarchaeota archaeon]|nr:hypothetical protein E2P71_10470 [Candidatus Bathyarchaeota archaeon]